jgi:hypothetical protein
MQHFLHVVKGAGALVDGGLRGMDALVMKDLETEWGGSEV